MRRICLLVFPFLIFQWNPFTLADEIPSSTAHTVIPLVYYTPDTQTALGLSTVSSFREDSDEKWKTSTLRNVAIITQRHQVVFQTAPEIYVQGGKYLLRGGIGFLNFPSTFYGIGSEAQAGLKESFTVSGYRVRFNPLYRLPFFGGNDPKERTRSWLGVQFEGMWNRFESLAPGGQVRRELSAFGHFQRYFGAGPTFRFDSRDATFFPSRGIAFETSFTHYDSFWRFISDVRAYKGFKDNILAFQLGYSAVDGRVPFNQLPSIGGARSIRGYRDNQFPGDAALYSQAEWRHQLSQRWGTAAFFGGGTLFGNREEKQRFFPAGGLGIRFALKTDDRLNLRADYAFGRDSRGFYLLVGESF